MARSSSRTRARSPKRLPVCCPGFARHIAGPKVCASFAVTGRRSTITRKMECCRSTLAVYGDGGSAPCGSMPKHRRCSSPARSAAVGYQKLATSSNIRLCVVSNLRLSHSAQRRSSFLACTALRRDFIGLGHLDQGLDDEARTRQSRAVRRARRVVFDHSHRKLRQDLTPDLLKKLAITCLEAAATTTDRHPFPSSKERLLEIRDHIAPTGHPCHKLAHALPLLELCERFRGGFHWRDEPDLGTRQAGWATSAVHRAHTHLGLC